MKVASYLLKNENFETQFIHTGAEQKKCQLVIGFGGKKLLGNPKVYPNLRDFFPIANIALCSTAGEIYENEVLDNSLSLIAIEFEKTPIGSAKVNIASYPSSFEAGADLVKKLNPEGLKYIFVLSDGSKVNGSELVRGIDSIIDHKIPVTGGLAGDGTDFSSTLVGLNEAPNSGSIIAIGFYNVLCLSSR